jgi:hypothetical protein
VMLGAYSGLALDDRALALQPREAALESLKIIVAGSLARMFDAMFDAGALRRGDERRRSYDLIAALQGIKQVWQWGHHGHALLLAPLLVVFP